MLDMVLLGTGGMCPMPIRALATSYTRINGIGVLFDCGEGTQVELSRNGISSNDIDYILITHLHADHVSGLMGVLLSMNMGNRKKPIKIIGPIGLKDYVKSFKLVVPVFAYPINIYEQTSKDRLNVNLPMSNGKLSFKSEICSHSVLCFCYSVELIRKRTFIPDKDKLKNLPYKYWGELSKGADVEYEGVIYKSSDFLGLPKKGVKFSYVTDTRPTNEIRKFITNSDIVVIEGMYREDSELQKAKIKKHMVWSESAKLVNNNGIKEVILTHFSPSLQLESGDNNNLKKLIPMGRLGIDGLKLHLDYPQDEPKSNETQVQSNASNKESLKKGREKIVREYFKRNGLSETIIHIEPVNKFKYKVELVGNIFVYIFVYRSSNSMTEPYNFYMRIDEYYVYYQQKK